MRAIRLLLPLALLVAAARPAAAGDDDSWNQVSVLGAVIYQDGSAAGGAGLTLARGWRTGGWHLLGEYSGVVSGVVEGPDSEDDGLHLLHRMGLGARKEVTHFVVTSRSMEIAFWLEGGVGYHRTVGPHARWRPDAVFGWAAEYRGDCMGMWLGARVLAAPTDRDAPGAIALGPSTPQPTPQTRPPFDVGLMVNLGIRWGR